MAALEEKLGYADRMLVASELFHLWVIQGPAPVREELPVDAAGLNVVWTDSLTPYRTLKVRILNGLHTTLCIPALPAGAETVRGALEDPLIGRFAARALDEEILPSLDMPAETIRAYADTVLERFRNPFIKHRLASISMNSVSKFKTRVLPSLLGYLEKKGAIPDALAFSLAALIEFYSAQKRQGERTSTGKCGTVAYAITDEPAILDAFVEMTNIHGTEPGVLCREVLGRTDLWGADLTSVEGLLPNVQAHLDELRRLGARETLRKVAG
jgi:tagaturonate reductase